MIKYPDIVAVYKISDRANAKKFMKIFKNTLIDKVLDSRSRAIPKGCLLYTSPSPRDLSTSRMPSSA